MSYKIFDSKEPLVMEKINEFETMINDSLPMEYVNFLLKHNGGYPEPNIFPFTMAGNVNDGLIQRFLGIHDDEIDGIYYYMTIYKDRIPKGLIPIAYDPGGNLILIGVSEDKHGKIYFWDHENEVDENNPPDYSNVFLISDGFNKFMSELTT